MQLRRATRLEPELASRARASEAGRDATSPAGREMSSRPARLQPSTGLAPIAHVLEYGAVLRRATRRARRCCGRRWPAHVRSAAGSNSCDQARNNKAAIHVATDGATRADRVIGRRRCACDAARAVPPGAAGALASGGVGRQRSAASVGRARDDGRRRTWRPMPADGPSGKGRRASAPRDMTRLEPARAPQSGGRRAALRRTSSGAGMDAGRSPRPSRRTDGSAARPAGHRPGHPGGIRPAPVLARSRGE